MDEDTMAALTEWASGKSIEDLTAEIAASGRVTDPETLAKFLFAKASGLL